MPATLLIALLAGPPVPANHFVPELKTDLGPHEHRVAFLHTTGFSGERRFNELTTGSPNAWGQDFLQHRRDYIGRWLQDENKLTALNFWRHFAPNVEDPKAWSGAEAKKLLLERRRDRFDSMLRDWTKVTPENIVQFNVTRVDGGVRQTSREIRGKEIDVVRRKKLIEDMKALLVAEVRDIYSRRSKDIDWIRENGPVTFTMRNGLDWRFPPEGDKRYSPGQARTILREKTFVVLSAEGVREMAEELRQEINGVETQVEKIPDLLVRDPDVQKLNDLIDKRVDERMREHDERMRVLEAKLDALTSGAASAEDADGR